MLEYQNLLEWHFHRDYDKLDQSIYHHDSWFYSQNKSIAHEQGPYAVVPKSNPTIISTLCT